MKKLFCVWFFIGGSTFLLAGPKTFTVDGPCRVAFSPNGGVTEMLVEYIDGSQSNIRLLAYNFTSQEIADALVRAHERGVDVQVVLDRSVPHESGSKLTMLAEAGIPAFIDKRHRIAHNKTIIIDSAWIETGSFNFTGNAEKNNGENAMICPSRSGAAIYLRDWEEHKNHSIPVQDLN